MTGPEPATKRRAMTPRRRAEALAKTGGVCAREGCDAPAVEIDHAIALGLTGAEDIANLDGLCVACHAEKTRIDKGLIAKAKRRAAKHFGERKPSTIRSRPFAKGPRRPIPSRPMGRSTPNPKAPPHD